MVIAALFACAVMLTLAGCGPGGTPSEPEPTPLDGVEVEEYQGQPLDSVFDMRENSIKGPQNVDIATYRLSVTGLVDTPLGLTYDEVLALPHYSKMLRLNCVEGWHVDMLWEGVLVSDLLAAAGADPEAAVLIFHAADGYSTSLPASYVRDNDILLAYRTNSVTLPASRGYPFMLVAEDKWGYKWCKWVTEIEVSNDTSYRGYWESFGYSNTGDLEDSFRE